MLVGAIVVAVATYAAVDGAPAPRPAGVGIRAGYTTPTAATSSSPAAAQSLPAASGPPATVATTTTSTTVPPTTVDPGALPPTADRPAAPSPALDALAASLWAAVNGGGPPAAAGAFFPEAAYVQLKALRDDRSDYTYRLLAHFALDIGAAHRLLGSQPAQLVGIVLPDSHVRWVPPGACANRIGYWYVAGTRIVYQVAGQTRSFGIAALDSWRGQWYVVHLGSELPPSGYGVVDLPAAGTGPFGSAGGC